MAIEDVIETVDVKTIYEAPISFNKEKLDQRVLTFLKLNLEKSQSSTLKKNYPISFKN